MTFKTKAYIVKLAFVILRKPQKQHPFTKNKNNYKKTNNKAPTLGVVIVISHGHSLFKVRGFFASSKMRRLALFGKTIAHEIQMRIPRSEQILYICDAFDF
ncbi:MAG: hypothetical protein ACK5MU_02735 [Candidatus Saccharimonadales bacterium]